MNPILRDRKSLFLYLLVWSAIGLLLAALLVVQGNAGWGGALLFSLPMVLAYAFASLSVWYVCRAFPLESTSLMLVLSVFLVSALLTSALWELCGFAWARVLGFLLPEADVARWHEQAVPLLAVAGVVLFLLSASVHYLVLTFENSRKAERNALELEVLARNAELKALRAQINPHFLFNSLNSISALTAGDPASARAMTLKLAGFLRLSMDYGARPTIPLEQELALALEFLEIEKVRFGSRLRVDIDVNAAAMSCAVPALLLQPLVENAVSHGIAHLLDGGTVRIGGRTSDNQLLLSVENPVDPAAPGGTGQGVGLDNVRQRLWRLHASAARVEARREGEVFVVALTLPAVQATSPENGNIPCG